MKRLLKTATIPGLLFSNYLPAGYPADNRIRQRPFRFLQLGVRGYLSVPDYGRMTAHSEREAD
jgi:hypothetical protein